MRNQAGADEYNEDWITDSDSEASAGKADEIMQKVNESHAQKNLIFEGEEPSDESNSGYDYDYSSYDSDSKEQSRSHSCESYSPSVTGSDANASCTSSRFAESNFSSDTEMQNSEFPGNHS